jgi:hypothetical protein
MPRDTTARMEAGRDDSSRMMQLHKRMMGDSLIRQRVMEDADMRRMMQDVMSEMSPAEHREMQRTMDRNSVGAGEPKQQQAPEPPAPSRENPRPAPADSAAHGGHHQHTKPQP